MSEQLNEGCRVYGYLEVNKVGIVNNLLLPLIKDIFYSQLQIISAASDSS